MAWTDWSKLRFITIESLPSEDAVVLVRLTASNFDFSAAQSGGEDIRFASLDGLTTFEHQRERHDALGELAEYYVQVPDGADLKLRMYYGNALAADTSAFLPIWDTKFLGRWDMSSVPGFAIVEFASSFADGEMFIPSEAELEISTTDVLDDKEMHVEDEDELSFTTAVYDDGAPP